MSDDKVVLFPGTSGEQLPESAREGNDTLVALVEALVFASGEPVTVKELVDAIGEDISPQEIASALHSLAQRTASRGVRLVKVAGGWQFRTDPRFADPILRLRGGKPQKMSKAALEALAVVAYRQPATRMDVEEIRGVKSGGVLKSLLDKGYVRVVGRRDEPGRPLEYGTTQLFLEMFSLDSLAALPTLKEREELARELASEDDDEEAPLPVIDLAELQGDRPEGWPDDLPHLVLADDEDLDEEE